MNPSFGSDPSDADDIWGEPGYIFYIPFLNTLSILTNSLNTKEGHKIFEFEIQDKQLVNLIEGTEAFKGVEFIGRL